MIEQLIHVVAPVFIAIGCGWVWAKSGRAYDTGLVSSLVMAIGAPCLVFSTLSTLTVSLPLLWHMGGAALAVIGLTAGAGWVALRMTGLPMRGFLPPIMFANIGNMGLPLCLFAFGKTGLALAIVVFSIYCVGQFTLGVWLYSGQAAMSALLRMPIIYSVGLSLIVLITGVSLPGWLLKTTEMLGSFTIPLMLLTLGVSLAQLRITDMQRAVVLSLLRLGIGFAAGFAVAAVLNLPWPARGVLILQSSMPVAVFNFLLSQRYNSYSSETAGLVVVSTLLSLVSLPLLLRFLNP